MDILYNTHMMKKFLNLAFHEKLSWMATVVLILGSGVNGIGYYPQGPLILSLGGIMWLGVAIMRRDWPLMIVNITMSFVGLTTVIYNLSTS